MSALRSILVAAALWLFSCSALFAQASVSMWCFNPTGSQATNNLYVPCSSTNPLQIAGTFSSTNPVGITPTDHTITSASGSSQQIMAANASRHSLTIVNTGNANCGVNPTGGTAAIGGAGTLTLAPTGAYTPRVPTLSAVTVICTAGQPIYADDN